MFKVVSNTVFKTFKNGQMVASYASCYRSLSYKVMSSQYRNFSTKFASSHEYAKLDGDFAVVGITEHAANALGDIVYVDLPSIGSTYSAGDTFGSVESVKAASDVYAPVSGEVVAINEALADAPGTVNESPMEKGWFLKLKVSAAGKKEFANLLDSAAYKELCEKEEH